MGTFASTKPLYLHEWDEFFQGGAIKKWIASLCIPTSFNSGNLYGKWFLMSFSETPVPTANRKYEIKMYSH